MTLKKIPKRVLLEKVWPQIQLLLYKMDSKFAISKFAVIFQAPKTASQEDLVYRLRGYSVNCIKPTWAITGRGAIKSCLANTSYYRPRGHFVKRSSRHRIPQANYRQRDHFVNLIWPTQAITGKGNILQIVLSRYVLFTRQYQGSISRVSVFDKFEIVSILVGPT